MSLHMLSPSIEWRNIVHLVNSHSSFRTQLTYRILQEVFSGHPFPVAQSKGGAIQLCAPNVPYTCLSLNYYYIAFSFYFPCLPSQLL